MIPFLFLAACDPTLLPPPADEDHDGHDVRADCDDHDRTRFPGAAERCDGRDDDCDGLVDEGFDRDGDGFGNALDPGCVALGPADCDDEDPEVHPGADERCDGLDQDCDGRVDPEVDADGDGASVCDDCDDDDAGARPDAPERCNGADDDCDGVSDEGFDADGDGWGECLDCDEGEPRVHPGASEVCNGRDDDCDLAWDEGFDADDDGFSVCRGDCEDGDPAVNPWAPEVCNGVDDDCDPTTDEVVDGDGDGFPICAADCDDDRAEAFAGASEACNGWDDDCDGDVDEEEVCAPCVTTFRNDRAYLLCEDALAWPDALAACDATGFRLVELETEDEDRWLSRELEALSGDRWWIGLFDDEGAWSWTDETEPSWNDWAPGEPDRGGCAATTRDGGWASAPCTTPYGYACEVPW